MGTAKTPSQNGLEHLIYAMQRVHITTDSRYPVDKKRIRQLVVSVLAAEKVTSDLDISIAIVGERKMRTLNRTYHEIDAPTDVLSFPYLDPESSTDNEMFVEPPGEPQVLGDIVVAYPIAVRQAGEKGKLVDDEIDFLIEHGLQHLLGHHHD
jgi:probable rRNA maturation factor